MLPENRLTPLKMLKADPLIEKLLCVARANPPNDRVPYAFEQRILARLQSGAIPDVWGLWEQVFWRSLPAFLGITLMLGAVTYTTQATWDSNSLQDDLESALYAEVESTGDRW